MSMSTSAKYSVDDVPIESVEMLETSLGEWSQEIAKKKHFIGMFASLYLASFFLMLVTFAAIRHSYEPDVSFPYFLVLLNLFGDLYIFCLTLLIVVPLLRSRFNSKRNYIVFSLSSSSNEKSEFLLSGFLSLLSFRRIVKPVNSEEDSLLLKEQEFASSSTTSKLQLNRFEISKNWLYEGAIVRPFVIALQKKEDTCHTFIFYSRHQSCWNHVLKYFKANSFMPEILHFKKIRV